MHGHHAAPRCASTPRTSRWLIVLVTVALVVPAFAQNTKPKKPRSTKRTPPRAAATQPAAPVEPTIPGSIGEARQRLAVRRASELNPAELAARAAYEFCIAAGAADGEHAGRLTDAVGYQALPPHGELPEVAERPIPVEQVQAEIAKRRRGDVARLPVETVSLQTRAALREQFPAVAKWMLPDDFALVASPSESAGGQWVTRRACLVIRVRGNRATIVGGTLLAALAE
ncbi:MAG: hypothetical protein AB7Q17_08800 [Phycisphaerae bacterium]